MTGRWSRAIIAIAIATTAASCDNTPTESAGVTVTGRRLAVGETTTCALAANGGLNCWGENSVYWQYGVQPTVVPSSKVPVTIPSIYLAGLSAGHAQHMCGLMPTKVARCWGRGSVGQTGLGREENPGNPVALVTGSNLWSDVFVSRLTSCGITTAGAAYCWGHNQRGEGGTASRGINVGSNTPIAVDRGVVFKSLALGWLHTCGLSATGIAYCWGDNRWGQLGIDEVDESGHVQPAQVATNLRFEQITAGANYTCAISTTHQAYCWGQNATGALGDGTAIDRPGPTLVSGTLTFTSIAASTGFPDPAIAALPNALQGGVSHTCGITESGAAYCWGWNAVGQLGDGTTVTRLVPTAVVGGSQLSAIALGGAHSCAMKGNAVLCWGSNAFGQLGNGSTANSSVPVMAGPPFATP